MPKEEGDQGERPMPKEERMGGAAGGKRFLIKKWLSQELIVRVLCGELKKKRKIFAFG